MLLFSFPYSGHLSEALSVSYTDTHPTIPLGMFTMEMLQILGIFFPVYQKSRQSNFFFF